MTATIITGVSRGLGEALFTALDGRGHRLLGVGRTFTDAQQRLATVEPDRVVLRAADLSDPAGPPADVARFVTGGAADEPVVLIHNAGAVEPIGAVGALDPARITASVTLNLTAPMVLTNAVLAAAADRPVRVLFISSGAARRPIGGWATYCATKAGGEMFVEVVAAQYADDEQVRVASVNPGVMDTDMQAVLRAADGAYFPDRDRYVGLAARSELPAPATVAARIIADHLADL